MIRTKNCSFMKLENKQLNNMNICHLFADVVIVISWHQHMSGILATVDSVNLCSSESRTPGVLSILKALLMLLDHVNLWLLHLLRPLHLLFGLDRWAGADRGHFGWGLLSWHRSTLKIGKLFAIDARVTLKWIGSWCNSSCSHLPAWTHFTSNGHRWSTCWSCGWWWIGWLEWCWVNVVTVDTGLRAGPTPPSWE